jgi:fatty acid desaturase
MERGIVESSQIISYKDLLLPHELDVLKKVSPIWGLINIALIWGCVTLLLFCLITLYESSWLLLLLGVIPGIVLAGVLQNAIVELAHEAAHLLIHPNKYVNDAFALLFLAGPLGIPFFLWRRTHLMHHAYFGDEDNDPDLPEYRNTPGSSREIIAWIFRSLFGIEGILRLVGILKTSRTLQKKTNKDGSKNFDKLLESATVPILHVCLFGSVAFQLGLKGIFLLVLFWYYPLFSVCQAIQRWRLWVEHGWVPRFETSSGLKQVMYVLDRTRSTIGDSLMRKAIGPFGINYHIEHHLYARVPQYNLPKLHALLMKNAAYQNLACIGSQYTKNCTRGK